MVEIHLYGKLRRHAKDCRPAEDCVIMYVDASGDTLASVLTQAGIPVDEINHIFVNAKLLASRNRMAPYYGYPQSGSDLSKWDLSIPVEAGDRIGLFGKDMAVLGM
ncbi:MAG TPA: hypothetical protein VLY63_29435 [Anaerolineae bacterium]|nr:hypothetical protein [Anaerolineae bacterium]